MRVFLLRNFLNSVNYNCARIHFSIAHFGPFYCCAFWTFQSLRVLDLSIVAHFGLFNCCAFWTFQLLRILNKIDYDCACAPSSGALSGPFILLLRKCAFFYCALWTTLIILAPVRDYLLRMFFLIVHPSSIDHSISFLRVLFMLHPSFIDLGVLFFCASLLLCIHRSSIRTFIFLCASLLLCIYYSSIRAYYQCTSPFLSFYCASIFH